VCLEQADSLTQARQSPPSVQAAIAGDKSEAVRTGRVVFRRGVYEARRTARTARGALLGFGRAAVDGLVLTLRLQLGTGNPEYQGVSGVSHRSGHERNSLILWRFRLRQGLRLRVRGLFLR